MIFNFNNKKIIIKSKRSKFMFCEDKEKEFTQLITINKNGRIEFESFNFNNELKRKEKKKLKIKGTKLIDDIKTVLEKRGIEPVAKDAGIWEVEIINKKNTTNYFGILGDENNCVLYDNLTISNYLKGIIDIQDLILLDDKID